MKSGKQTPERATEGHGKVKVWKMNWAIYFLRAPEDALAAFDGKS